MQFLRRARTLLPAALLFTAGPATAATDIYNGLIDTDTTWTAAGSPYLVHVHVWVSHGVTLTIEPGVTVSFDSDLALVVDGKLVAIGTKHDPILFTSLSNPTPGAWRQLGFTPFAEPGVVNANGEYVGGSVFERCIIEYGGSVRAAVEVSGAPPAMLRTVVRYPLNSAVGEAPQNYAIESAPFYVGQCIMVAPSVVMQLSKASQVAIVDSALVPGTVAIGGSPWPIDVRVDGCVMYTLILGSYSASPGQFTVEHTRILSGLESTHYGGIAWTLASLCSFENPASGGPRAAFTGLGVVTGCDFGGPVASEALRAGFWWETPTTMAENNYWGTTLESEIEKRIWDFFDDPGLAAVDFRPFSTEPHWQFGDLDWDGDTDLADFLKFQECFSGSNVLMDVECIHADLDTDLDVDLADFTIFQANFTGSR